MSSTPTILRSLSSITSPLAPRITNQKFFHIPPKNSKQWHANMNIQIQIHSTYRYDEHTALKNDAPKSKAETLLYSLDGKDLI